MHLTHRDKATLTTLKERVRYSRAYRAYRRWWLHGFVWRVEGWLLDWTEDAEPCDDYEARLLAVDDDGDWLVPAPIGYRNGEPWWQGYWHWWWPGHWPVYLRSRRRNTYVMVEHGWGDE